jgi:hypothetical protein
MSNSFLDISLRTIELRSQLNQVFHFGASLRPWPKPSCSRLRSPSCAAQPQSSCYPGSHRKIRLMWRPRAA